MELETHLGQMKDFQKNVLDYIDDTSHNSKLLFNLIKESKIEDNNNDLKLVLHFISKLSNNHYKNQAFWQKIESILSFYSEKIKQNFQNFDIFNIFKSNKRILLFLFQEKIIIPEENIVNIMLNEKYSMRAYPNYFISEIKDFIDDKLYKKIEKQNQLNIKDYSSFEEKRLTGENENFLCSLIRNDSIEDFISYVNTANVPLTITISKSIFETNAFLMDKEPSMIEYAAFHGAVQIFKYLLLNKIKLQSSILLYAIHGKNSEIIHILEENNIILITGNLSSCIKESIKCHHNEITEYFLNNFSNGSELFNHTDCLKSYNFEYLPLNLNYKMLFAFLCRYDYITIVEFLLKSNDIDINLYAIQIPMFL